MGLDKQSLSDAFSTQPSQGYYHSKADYSKREKLIREDSLDFAYSARALSQGSMQMNVTKYEKNKSSGNDIYRHDWLYEHKDWDIDGIHKQFEPGEGGGKAYMTLGKSVIVYRGKSVDKDFKKKNLLSMKFLEAACHGSSLIMGEEELKNGILKTKRYVTLVGDFITTSFFHIYDDLESFLAGENVPTEFQSSWRERAGEIDLKLARITTTYSAKNNITPSDYSAGGRTINFYYDIDGHNTLHVSYKIVSFRNVRNLGFIGVHQKTIDSQYDGTFESLKKIEAL